jgi:hypothetical protein
MKKNVRSIKSTTDSHSRLSLTLLRKLVCAIWGIIISLPLPAQTLINTVNQPGLNPTCVTVWEGQDRVFIADSSGIIFIYDGSTLSLLDTITTDIEGINHLILIEKYGKLYAASQDLFKYNIAVIDANTGDLIRYMMDVGNFIQLDKDEELGKVYSLYNSGFDQIDAATDSVKHIPGIVGTVLSSLAVNPVTHEIFHLWGAYSPPLSVINPYTLTHSHVEIGGYGIGVNWNENKIYVGTLGGPFYIYNRNTGNVTETPTGNDATILVYNPTKNCTYTDIEVDGWTTIIDGSTDSSYNVPIMYPCRPYVCYATNHVFYTSDPIIIMDGNTSKLTTIGNMGVKEDALAINQVTRRIYAATKGRIMVIQDQEGSTLWPTAPNLLEPYNYSPFEVPTNPTLRWNASPIATSYHLQVSTMSNFYENTYIIVDQDGITDTSYYVSSLPAKTQYYWHVNSTNGQVASFYSGTWSFRTADYAVPTRKRGDVNGNGVDPGDATSILRIIVGLDPEPAPGTDAFYGADANADGTISPIDASWVLYYLVNDEYPNHTLPKVSVSSTIAFGKISENTVENKGQVIDLPLVLTKSGGVISAYVDLHIDNSVADVQYVNAKLPEGSSMLYNYKHSALKIAIAGIHEMADGTIIHVGISLKENEARLEVSGIAKLNDNPDIALENVSIREIPTSFAIQNNYPNPFNPTTTIKYQIPENAHVRLVVYNTLGQRVRTIVDQPQEAGYYSVEWDGRNNYGESVSSGIYVYRISAMRDGQAGSFVASKKMNLIK